MKNEVTINAEQRLYVIPCGAGYTCLGFDVCETRANALAAELAAHEGIAEANIPKGARAVDRPAFVIFSGDNPFVRPYERALNLKWKIGREVGIIIGR